MERDLIDIQTAAVILGVTKTTIRRWAADMRPWALTRYERPAPAGVRGDPATRVLYSRAEVEALKASGRIFKRGHTHNNAIDTRSDIP